MPVASNRPSGYPCFHLTRLHIRGSMISSSYSISCCNGPENSGKALYFQFIINNEYDKGWAWTARGRGTQHKGWEGSQAQKLLFPLSWGYVPSGHVKRSPTQKLFKPRPLGIFLEALSHRHDWLLTPSSALLPSPEDGGWSWKFQASKHDLEFQVNQPPSKSYLRAHQELPCENQKMHPGNSKGFGYSVSGTRDKDQVLEQCS